MLINFAFLRRARSTPFLDRPATALTGAGHALGYTLSFSHISLTRCSKDKFLRLDLQNILNEQLVNHHYPMLKHLLGLLFISKYTQVQAHIATHHTHTTQTHTCSVHTYNHTHKHISAQHIYINYTHHTTRITNILTHTSHHRHPIPLTDTQAPYNTHHTLLFP